MNHSTGTLRLDCIVEGIDTVGKDIARIALGMTSEAALPRPGQFYSIRCGHTTSPLLRRPLSVHRVRTARDGFGVDLLVRVVGPGTAWLCSRRPGDRLDVIGPLGNGFDVKAEEVSVLVARGIGIAPLVALGQALRERQPRERLHFIAGARLAERLFLQDELNRLGVLHTYTDNGSEGFEGRAPDLLRHLATTGVLGKKVAVYACGPDPMLREIALVAEENAWPGQAALEAHMGCGMGACLTCAVPLRPGAIRTGPLWPKPALQWDAERRSVYSLICRDGPVYDLREVDWHAWCA